MAGKALDIGATLILKGLNEAVGVLTALASFANRLPVFGITFEINEGLRNGCQRPPENRGLQPLAVKGCNLSP